MTLNLWDCRLSILKVRLQLSVRLCIFHLLLIKLGQKLTVLWGFGNWRQQGLGGTEETSRSTDRGIYRQSAWGGSHPTQQLTHCLQTQITQLPLPQVNPRRKADLEGKSTCFTEISLPHASFQGVSQGSGSLPVELASADIPTQETEEVSFSF